MKSKTHSGVLGSSDAALRSSLKIVPDPEVAKLRTLLNGWLYSGAMTGDQLDKLRSDTEKAVQNV